MDNLSFIDGDPNSLDVVEVFEFLRRGRAAMAAVQAWELRALQVVRARLMSMEPVEPERKPSGSPGVPGGAGVAGRVASELGMTVVAAQKLLRMSTVVVGRLPKVLAQMEAGRLSRFAASKIVEVVAPVPADKVAAADERIAARVAGRSAPQVRRLARDVVNSVDPEGAAIRAQVRRAGRGVRLFHGEGVMSTLRADLPSEVAIAAIARLTCTAKALKASGDSRTLDQLRADVLRDVLLDSGKGLGPVNAEVLLQVPVGVGLNLSEGSVELVGYGPVPGKLGREIAADANSVWRKLLVDDDSGLPVAVEETGQRVEGRGRRCWFWGCDRIVGGGGRGDHGRRGRGKRRGRATAGGPVLCAEHRQFTDLTGWQYRLDREAGVLVVTTPGGRRMTYPVESGLLPEPRPADQAA